MIYNQTSVNDGEHPVRDVSLGRIISYLYNLHPVKDATLTEYKRGDNAFAIEQLIPNGIHNKKKMCVLCYDFIGRNEVTKQSGRKRCNLDCFVPRNDEERVRNDGNICHFHCSSAKFHRYLRYDALLLVCN